MRRPASANVPVTLSAPPAAPPSSGAPDTLVARTAEISACRACPRLVEWREAAAANPPARFRGEEYHARPVPGFGDRSARFLLLEREALGYWRSTPLL